jgi:hypothetical protein
VVPSNAERVPVADAVRVRVRGGKTLIAGGPFAKTYEQLGGYYWLESKGLDEALAWAAKIPTAKTRYGVKLLADRMDIYGFTDAV